MSETLSTMLKLGTKAPNFELENVIDGKKVSLDQANNNKALLIIFMCVHCPYVQHVKHEIAKIGKDYIEKGLGVVAISSNDVEKYPEDAPENMKKMAEELRFNFPFLYDETQNVAKEYTAACTPDFFLFDKDTKLVYRGQLDDSRPGNDKPTDGKDLRRAIEAVLSERNVLPDQKPSSGCNIKWKAGNEPSYFS